MNNKLERLHNLEKQLLIVSNVFLGYGACLILFKKWIPGIIMISLWFIGLIGVFIITGKIVDLKHDMYRTQYLDITGETIGEVCERFKTEDYEIVELKLIKDRVLAKVKKQSSSS